MQNSSKWLFRALTLGVATAALAFTLSSSSDSASAQKPNYEDFLKGDRKEVTEIEGQQVWRYDSKTLIALLSKNLGIPVLGPQAIGGQSFIHSGDKLEDSPQADAIIAGMLHGTGFALVVQDGLARVVNFSEARALASTVAAADLANHKAYEVVRVVVKLKSADAFDLRDQLVQSVTPGLGQVLPFDAGTGSGVICDYASNVRNLIAALAVIEE